MEIAVVIHKDKNSVYGVTVLDIPGCFSWGDTIQDAIRNTREAVEAHTLALLEEGTTFDLQATKIDELQAHEEYANGILALVDIDLA